LSTTQILDKEDAIVAEVTNKLLGLSLKSFIDYQGNKGEVLILLLILAKRAYELSRERRFEKHSYSE